MHQHRVVPTFEQKHIVFNHFDDTHSVYKRVSFYARSDVHSAPKKQQERKRITRGVEKKMTVKEILEANIEGSWGSSNTYLAPNIPEKKLHNAAKIVAGGIEESKILGILDLTIFGSAKDGLAFTEDGFYFRYSTEESKRYVAYKIIKKIKVITEGKDSGIFIYDDYDIIFTHDTILDLSLLGKLLLLLANKDGEQATLEIDGKLQTDATTGQNNEPDTDTTETNAADTAEQDSGAEQTETTNTDDEQQEEDSVEVKNISKTEKKETSMENELMISEDGDERFSEILRKIKDSESGSVEYVIDQTQLIAKLILGGTRFEFYPEQIKIYFGIASYDLGYGELRRITSLRSKKKTEDGDPIYDFFFDKKQCASFSGATATDLQNMLRMLSKSFGNGKTCTPKYEVAEKIKEFSLKNSADYNATLYTLLLKYSEKAETMADEELLPENSQILLLLEEHSGKIIGNIGDTLKKNLGNLFSISGAISVAKSIGGSAFTRTANDMLSGSDNFLVLTDRNVIACIKNECTEYQLDDVLSDLTAKDDEVLANVVDIYNDDDEKILEDISKEKWLLFRKKVKKMKREAEEMPSFSQSMSQSDEEPFAENENVARPANNGIKFLTCDKCGAQSPVGKKFCVQCGDPFILCPVCKKDNPSQTKFCVFCGSPMKLVCKNCRAEYTPGSAFCGNCGQKLS